MDPTDRPELGRRSYTLISVMAAVAVLYLGRPVLVPAALAILLAFIVAPVVVRVERVVRSRGIAIVIVTLALVGLLAGGTLAVGQQVVSFADQLPSYRETIVRKVRAIRSPSGPLSRAVEAVRSISAEALEGPPGAAKTPPTPAPAAETAEPTVPWSVLSTLMEPLGTAAVVLLLLVMVLKSMENIRDRAIRLAGLHQIGLTTQTLEEAGTRVGRYLRAQLLINTIFATVVGLGLLLLGIPNALLCGVLAGALRFAPVIGPWLGAVFPAALALAVFDDWFHIAGVAALLLGVEIAVNTAVEPWLYGASTGLSPLGVVLALVFWTWVWGGVGLVLAVPMTVCLLVFSRQIPQLGVISILLGQEPVLTEPARYYQRLLGRDELEAAAILGEPQKDRQPLAVVDDIFLPALAAAKSDLNRGLITYAQAAMVGSSARDVAVEWLQEHLPQAEATSQPFTVACLPVADGLDEAAASMLSWLLRREGVQSTAMSAGMLFSERIAAAQATEVDLVVCSTLDAMGSSPVRRSLRALERRSVRIIVAAWTSEQAGETSSIPIVRTISGAIAAVRAAMNAKSSAAAGGAPAGSR